jgi:hypothetical protein
MRAFSWQLVATTQVILRKLHNGSLSCLFLSELVLVKEDILALEISCKKEKSNCLLDNLQLQMQVIFGQVAF